MTFLALVALFLAQAASAASFVGTLAAVRAQSLEVEIKRDSGESVAAQLSPETILQRVAPGQRDLKNATPMNATELALGDRVLVTLLDDNRTIRRLVVMDAGAIVNSREARRQEWTTRGLMGLAGPGNGEQIAVKLRADARGSILTQASTKVRRYPPDSVAFADTVESSLHEIKPGDLIWARGSKDGNTVTAEEIVFGSIVTLAAEVVAVDTAASTLSLRDAASRKPLTVKIASASQLKRMPDFGSMLRGGAAPGGMPPGGPLMGGAMPDPAMILERSPTASLADFKPGETVIFSAAAPPQADRFTAIALVGNAGFLLRMLSMRENASGPGGMPGGAMMLDFQSLTF